MREKGSGERAGSKDVSPTTSLVHWALLGLVIERPSYAYKLADRFERRYGAVLALSNVGHVYTALGALGARELIEEIPGTRQGRQPKPRYRATTKGLDEYRAWLIGQVEEDRRRQQLFVLALAPLIDEPEQLLTIVAQYEQAWMKAGMKSPLAQAPLAQNRSPANDRTSALLCQLTGEENRLAVGAKLAWVQYLREQVQALAEPGQEHG